MFGRMTEGKKPRGWLPPINRFVLSLIKAAPSGMVCGLAGRSMDSGLHSLPAGDLWANYLPSSPPPSPWRN